MKARKLGQEERKKDSLDLTVLAVLGATALKKKNKRYAGEILRFSVTAKV